MRRFLSRLVLVVLCSCACTALDARTVTVEVGGTTTTGDPYDGYSTSPVLMFNPADITVDVGDTVVFSSLGGAPHNVHADDNSFRCAAGCDGDGQGGNGAPSAATWTSSVTFTKPGVVDFHCDTHQMQGMTGRITVNGTAAPGITLGGYMSGNWYNPSQGGHGFQLELTNTHEMIAIWFVYTPDGTAQSWIYAQDFWDGTKNTATLPAIILTGAKFPPNFVEGDVHRQQAQGWGTLTFTFSDCNHGTVSWHSDAPGYNAANDTPLPITRLTQIAGTSCPP